MTTFQTILTNYGLQRMALAESSGIQINLVNMSVGDGAGNPTTPSETQTQLVRETYRHAINRVYQDPTNPLLFTAELVIPASVGGFVIREAGIFDDANKLFAVANTPDAYKPQGDGSEGAFGDTVLRMQFMVTNAEIVTLQIDPNVAVASQSWVIGTITLPFLLKGGTTGQVLSKHSNADGDVVWVDAAAAVDVIVDATVEKQVLAAEQTVVNLGIITTDASGIYIEGARLIEVDDFTINSPTKFTLARSYPAGSRIHMYQNDPTSEISDATEVQHGFIKLATKAEVEAGVDDAHAVTSLKLAQRLVGLAGDAINLKMNVGAVSQSATVTADQVIVANTDGVPFLLSGLNKAINLASLGAGGMDASGSVASAWIAIYVIYNAETGDSELLGTINSNPPEVYSGAGLPVGYTASALVSLWESNASGQFMVGRMEGREVTFSPRAEIVLSTPTAGFVQSGQIGDFPGKAKCVHGAVTFSATGSGQISISVADDALANGSQQFLQTTLNGGNYGTSFRGIRTSVAQRIFYQVSISGGAAGSASIFCTGYKF